jgi:GntR family transcriptional regulator/MocR family aminotransferase
VTAGLQVGQAGQIRAEPRPADSASPRLSALGHRLAAMPMPALPTAAQSECIDFLYGAIAAADHPSRLWLQACQAELRQPQQRLYYDPPQGDPALRQALQGHLRRARGLDCDAERILIVHGSQQAIDLCARVLLDGGDRFVIEDPAYLMARRCFELAGARRCCTGPPGSRPGSSRTTMTASSATASARSTRCRRWTPRAG